SQSPLTALAKTPGGRRHSWGRGCLPRSAVPQPPRRRLPGRARNRWEDRIGCPPSRRSARAHAKSCRKSGDRHRRFHSRSTAGLAVAVIEPAELGAADLGIVGLWVARPGDCWAAEDWLEPKEANSQSRAGCE